MHDQNHSGKWAGKFFYGNIYPKELRAKPVAFELNLTVTDGTIEGTCHDEETFDHFDRPATINGFIQEDFISFIKKYPYYFELNPDNINERNFQPGVESHEIHYTGYFRNDAFVGDWEMISTYKDEMGFMHQDRGYGSWSMRKK